MIYYINWFWLIERYIRTMVIKLKSYIKILLFYPQQYILNLTIQINTDWIYSLRSAFETFNHYCSLIILITSKWYQYFNYFN